MSSIAALLFLVFAAPCGCNVLQHRAGLGLRKSAPGSASAADEGMIKPFRFNQKILVCNAYPSKSPMLVEKNRAEALADKEHAISFKECRYLKGRLQAQDRLDLMLRDIEVKGTFEVGELPSTDAVLLLVLEKRPGSPMISFQSFAFPSSSEGNDAQLAVIDTYRGNSSAPHLKMEDHITGKEAQTVSKRIEQLNFNHVYAVEEGTYDAFVNDKLDEALAKSTKKVLKLAKSQNYVVLRTGEQDHFAESLVVFPENMQSGSQPLCVAWLVMLAVGIAGAIA